MRVVSQQLVGSVVVEAPAAGSTLDGPESRWLRRRERFAAQRVLWRESTLPRVRGCGRARSAGADTVQLRVTATPGGSVAGLAGLQSCGSVWACPVCSAKVLASRQGDISQAVEAWRATGGRVAMGTLSVRHDLGHSITEVWDGVSVGFDAVTACRDWQDEKERYGVEVSRETITTCAAKSCGQDSARGRRHAAFCKVGTDRVKYVLPWVRVAEVTVGDAFGWHVHTHFLLFLPAGTTDGQLWALYDSMWVRWAAGAAKAGLDDALRVNDCHFFEGDVAEVLGSYVTKGVYSAGEKAGLEMARGDLKSGRFGNRSPFEVLRDVVLPGEDLSHVVDDAALWAEFERGSHGRRQMLWAHGARELLGLDVEKSDEEIAAEETGTLEDALLDLPGESVWPVVGVPGRRASLLEAAEVGGFAAAAQLLDSWGVAWSLPRVSSWDTGPPL